MNVATVGGGSRPWNNRWANKKSTYAVDLLDHAILVVRPREPYLRWAKGDGAVDVAIDDLRNEPTAYAVARPGDDEPETAIRANWRPVFEAELGAWDADESTWPTNRTYALFREWFDVDVHVMVLNVVAADRPSRQEIRSLTRSGTSFPLDDRQAIVELAEWYWAVIKSKERDAERALEAELDAARQRGHLDKRLFLWLARWKSPRSAHHYESNTDLEIETATRDALQAESDAAAIAALMRLRGVRLRTATALLHWMIPDRFPIIDFRVIDALGEEQPRSWDDITLYDRIAGTVRQLAARHCLDLRTVDRALWTWQKLHRAATRVRY